MRIRIDVISVLALGAMLLSAHAQQPVPDTPAARSPELALSYDLVGSNAPAGQCGCFVLNGGSATAAVPIPVSHLSIAGQLSTTHAGGIGNAQYSLTLLTYLIGIRYTIPVKKRQLNLFAQGLIGGSHASGSLVGVPNPGAENAGLSLAGSIGGGLDVRWKQHLLIRAIEVDYHPTTFSNQTTAVENNYRVSAGIVFRLK